MTKAILRLALGCLAFACLGVLAAPALGAAGDPVLVLSPEKPKDPKEPKNPPPIGFLEGPCGLGVAANSDLYVSDYYHNAVDIFNSGGSYKSQIPNVDPVDGPCGLAFNSVGSLYVNNFHRNVFNLSAGSALALPAEEPAQHLPTGVAVDQATNTVYVNNRTYISAFLSTGAPVMDGLESLKIGVGNIGDGFGLAVSAFPETTGRIYVPDAVTNTVKIFDPTLSKVTPVAAIKGPGKGFNSLRDSAVAVDRVTGVVYIVDNLQPAYTEEPEAAVYVYNSANAFLGVLKYKIYDALAPGLAVDNSAAVTQGRVYVTSGNTDQAGVYGYLPGAQIGSFLPPSVGAVIQFKGSGGGSVASSSPSLNCTDECTVHPLAASKLTLTATPEPGSVFSGWSGACSGSGDTCAVSMDESRTVTASFASLPSTGEAPASGYGPAADSPAAPAPEATPPPNADHPQKAKHHRHHKKKHRRHR